MNFVAVLCISPSCRNYLRVVGSRESETFYLLFTIQFAMSFYNETYIMFIGVSCAGDFARQPGEGCEAIESGNLREILRSGDTFHAVRHLLGEAETCQSPEGCFQSGVVPGSDGVDEFRQNAWK